jgi:hypothetical protein
MLLMRTSQDFTPQVGISDLEKKILFERADYESISAVDLIKGMRGSEEDIDMVVT